jgi:hypothetical protein
MNKQPCENQLDWLAFCYAAGELDGTEAEQFELRLAEDQTAREALARAVELTQTMAAAESQCGDFVVPAARAKSDWNTRLSWMAVGGLASALLAALWSGVVGPTWQTAQERMNAAARQDLAFAWNETRAEIANVKEAGLWPAGPAIGSDFDDDFGSDELGFEDTTMEEGPSWLTAAVLGPSEDSDSPAESF